jgi:hypothetical protein
MRTGERENAGSMVSATRSSVDERGTIITKSKTDRRTCYGAYSVAVLDAISIREGQV